ncbi:MAG: hypothetical protein JSR72_01290 [Proteobacteria bacterium]|nr:hypothetical protein [Pseudomonadota bacterium]
MKLVLIMEIALFVAAFVVLHRALRRGVDEAVRWEIAVASEMNKPVRPLPPRARVAADDEPVGESLGRDGDYDNDRVRPATL